MEKEKYYENKTFHFDGKLAKKYGIVEAVLIDNFKFWIDKNVANKHNYHDGRTWVYNSVTAFERQFPFMTARQLRHSLSKLVEANVILTGNYNKTGYDKTKWYAFVDEKLFGINYPGAAEVNNEIKPEIEPKNASDKIVTSIGQNQKMDTTELSNGFDKKVRPIPYTVTDAKPNTEIHTNKPEYINDEQKGKLVSKFNSEKKDKISDKGIRICMADKIKLFNAMNDHLNKYNESCINNERVFGFWFDYVSIDLKEDKNKFKWCKAWVNSFISYCNNHKEEINERQNKPTGKHPNLYQQMMATPEQIAERERLHKEAKTDR
jgi:hypothetical protein